MTTLLLRLAGPMQSWGDSSRFTRRETRHEPTKSGVLGLLAAAQGRRRTDSLADLLQLTFGVRVDQTGEIVRDFQTAQKRRGGRVESLPLSYRYYLSDAVFVAGVEGPDDLVQGLAEALAAPVFPIYLGRRSCPPSRPVLLGVTEENLVSALHTHDWEASDWYRRRKPRALSLRLVVDADCVGDDASQETVRDVPLSFAPTRREYGWRSVVDVEGGVSISNPLGRRSTSSEADYFEAVSGA